MVPVFLDLPKREEHPSRSPLRHPFHTPVKLLDNLNSRHGRCPVGLLIAVIPTLVFPMERLHHNPITPRKNIDALVGEPIVHSLLGDQPGNLATNRNNALVRPQLGAP
jgi:hypothetical protein